MKPFFNRKAFTVKSLAGFVDDSLKKEIVDMGVAVAKQGATIAQKALLTMIHLKGLDPNYTPPAKTVEAPEPEREIPLKWRPKNTYMKDIEQKSDRKVIRAYGSIQDLLLITNHEKLNVDYGGFFKRSRPVDFESKEEDIVKNESLYVVRDFTQPQPQPLTSSSLKEALTMLTKYASYLKEEKI